MSEGLFEIRMIYPLSMQEKKLLSEIEEKKTFKLLGADYKVDFVRYNFSSDGFSDSVDIRAYIDEL